jgi:hypothetical protein
MPLRYNYFMQQPSHIAALIVHAAAAAAAPAA